MAKKHYLVEFTHITGETQVVEFNTNDIEWSIDQWCRNRSITRFEIINEGNNNQPKQMLFG